MDKNKLERVLLSNNVPNDLYSLNGGLPNESYCLNKVHNKWEVYYSERGIKSGSTSFSNESEACEYFLKEIGKIVSITSVKA